MSDPIRLCSDRSYRPEDYDPTTTDPDQPSANSCEPRASTAPASPALCSVPPTASNEANACESPAPQPSPECVPPEEKAVNALVSQFKKPVLPAHAQAQQSPKEPFRMERNAFDKFLLDGDYPGNWIFQTGEGMRALEQAQDVAAYTALGAATVATGGTLIAAETSGSLVVGGALKAAGNALLVESATAAFSGEKIEPQKMARAAAVSGATAGLAESAKLVQAAGGGVASVVLTQGAETAMSMAVAAESGAGAAGIAGAGISSLSGLVPKQYEPLAVVAGIAVETSANRIDQILRANSR